MKNIRKILLVLVIALTTLTSCEKEPLDPYQREVDNCTCGTIANDGITGDCYWLEIRNDCSGNKKKFCFDKDIWLTGYVGESFCVQGVESW